LAFKEYEKIRKIRGLNWKRLLFLFLALRDELQTITRKQLVAKIMEREAVSRATAYDYANALKLLAPTEEKHPALEDFLPEEVSVTPKSEKMLYEVLPLLVKLLNWSTTKGLNPYVKLQNVQKRLFELLDFLTNNVLNGNYCCGSALAWVLMPTKLKNKLNKFCKDNEVFWGQAVINLLTFALDQLGY